MADHRGREEAEEEAGARFDLAAGTGDPLADLPAVAAIGPRGAPARRLEAQLEPLHRLVFGRAGRAGERRRALDAFRGFPPDMRDDVAERVGRLSKEKLRTLIDVLGVPAHISNPRAKVAEDVVAFLMHPSVEGAKRGHAKGARPASKGAKRGRTASTRNSPVNASPKEEETVGAKTAVTGKAATKSPSPKTKASKRAATTTTPADEGVKAKRTKKELPVAERSASANPPSDDALRVAVYKRILLTPREERANLTTKALRLELQESFGELEARKAVIKEAASECITALVAAEEAAAAAATATGRGTVTTTSTTMTLTEGGTFSVSLPGASSEAARTSGNGGDHTVEPSPAPQPPSMQLTDAAASTRSQPPPPETPDSSVAQHSSVPSFPAHPPVMATVVSAPSCPPPGAPIV